MESECSETICSCRVTALAACLRLLITRIMIFKCRGSSEFCSKFLSASVEAESENLILQ